MQWDDELLGHLSAPRSMMPAVLPSSAAFGQTRAEPFGAPIRIAGVGGDQQAATFGQACHHPGMAKNTYTTGCFMLMNTGNTAITSKNNFVSTVDWTLPHQSELRTDYMLEGSIFMAGTIVQWLRDGLELIKTSADVESLASTVADAGGVTFVPAFTGLGAPYWDAYARGTIVGMERGTTGRHIARAALESIAYQSIDVLDAMQKGSGMPLQELRGDGGGACNDLLMQFQADVLGVPVVRRVVTETTALGAAYLAGLEVGFWESRKEIASQWKTERRFEPVMTSEERASRIGTWRRAVERCRRWA
jgi:glycerol kinase